MFLILLASKHTQPISKLKQRRISSFWTSFWNLNGKPPYICSWRRLHGYAKESRIERLTKREGGGGEKKQKIIYFSCVGYMYFRWFWTEQVKSRHWIKDVSWLSADIRAQLKFSSFQRRVLEEEFQRCWYPSSRQRDILAYVLELRREVVQVIFQKQCRAIV